MKLLQPTSFLLNSILILLLFINCNGQSKKNNTPNLLNVDAEERGFLLTSINQGRSWQVQNKGLPFNIQVTFLDRIDQQIYLASEQYGLFSSNSENINWQQLETFVFPNQKITALHIHENKIYAAVYRAGLFVSENGGATWKEENRNLDDLAVVSINVIDTFALIGTDSGIYKAPIKNLEWKKVFDGAQINSLNINKNRTHLIAGTSKGVLHSEDKGESWQSVLDNKPMHNTAIINEYVFAMSIRHGLHRSNDFGKTWLDIDADLPDGAYVFEMIKQGNQLIASHHAGIYISNNLGVNWELVYPTAGERFRDFLIIDGLLFGGTVKR